MKIYSKNAIVLLLSLTLTVGCQTVKDANNKQKGAVIGAAGGALLGAIIGNNVGSKENSELGAVIGGVLGGTAGVLIGNQMDKQAEEIANQIPGAEVTRVGDGIVINFDEDSGVFFETGKTNVSNESVLMLSKLSNVMKEYQDTNIIIAGHTDSVGADAANMTLSKNRAKSVENVLIANGVASNRFTTVWYGETQPIASNDTAAGRAKNRRVTLGIVPNEEMKKQATKEAGQ